MDVSNLFSVLPDILGLLPTLLYTMQWMFYLFFIWFYGSISMKGGKKHMPVIMDFGIKFLMGVLCLVGGIAFAGFVPFFSDGIMHIMQIDMLVAGLLVSVLLALAYRLITHDGDVMPGDTLDALRRKVVVLEEMLRKGAKHIAEKDARKMAEAKMPGYKADTAKLLGNEWEIDLKLGEKRGRVILDAWDGELKKRIKKLEVGQFFKDAQKVAGLALVIALIAASAVFFDGFPDPTDSFSSMFGVSMQDIASISESLRDNPLFVSEDCISPLSLTRYRSNFEDLEYVRDHIHEDESDKGLMEVSSGKGVNYMLRIDHEGKELILAIMDDLSLCYLTDGEFCGCLDGGQG